MRSVPQGDSAEDASSAGSQTQSRGGGIGCWTWPRLMQLEAHKISDSFKKTKVKAAVCGRVLLRKQLSKRSEVAVTILEAARTARLHGLRRRCGVPAVNSVPVQYLGFATTAATATSTSRMSLRPSRYIALSFTDSTWSQLCVARKHTVAVEDQRHRRQHVYQLGDNTTVGPASPNLGQR